MRNFNSAKKWDFALQADVVNIYLNSKDYTSIPAENSDEQWAALNLIYRTG